ncbi:MAG: pitrilysin family protein [Gemmatimonadota bacterium]
MYPRFSISHSLRMAAMFTAMAGPLVGQTPARRASAPSAVTTSVEIPYQRFVLRNGLTLIVHEDHKAPIVAVNIWYHVGSKNERPGRTGFAHLFEHLMFNGSDNYNADYFGPFEEAGATDQNGTTNEDRTNYFENVPTPAIDMALWMESDRMGHLLGVLDTAKLNEQRGVVQNEKREGENEPYGKTEQLITEATYPVGHPYSWTVIGSMDDLNSASVEDVKTWFTTSYGAANAVIVLAGDIDAATAKQKVEQYFGDIPSGPPVTHQSVWVAPRTGVHRQTMEDRVPQARIYMVWNIPQWGSREGTYLDLVSDVLGAGKTSRLYKRLVYDDQSCTDVAVFTDLREIGGQFLIQATVKPDGDPAAVERAINEEMTRFLATGPTARELHRVQTRNRANFIRGVERIGGFGGKSDVLAQGEVFAGSPEHYKTTLGWVAGATPSVLLAASKRWLSDGVYILTVNPFPDFAADSSGVDRSKVPVPGAPPAVRFPAFARDTLSNGLKVILAERRAVPQVNLELLIDAGYAADQFGKPGTASLAMNMLDEGTTTLNALQISDTLAMLGARLFTGSGLDMSQVSLSALRENLDPSLAVFADVILHPAFPLADFERLQRQRLAGIQREKVQPMAMALRVFPQLLYGPQHAYGNPLTGSGTAASVTSINRQDLVDFHRTWFKPNNATIIVVGATTMAEIKPKLERLFAGWRSGTVPVKNIAPVSLPAKPAVYIVDRPGSDQSVIFAGNVAPPRGNPDEVAIQAMNTLLGGNFTSRVNMNLREDKHWSYGAFTILWDAKGQRPFFAYAPVQTDKTKESMAELVKELHGIQADRPAEAAELERAEATMTLTLPGQWETMDAVQGSIADIVTYGLPDNYYDTFASRVHALNPGQMSGAAKEVIAPDQLIWVVVGDRAMIEPGIRELNLGPINFIDADGNPLNRTTP